MDIFILIADLGLPIASGLVMGYFIFLVMKQLMDGLVDEIKTVQGISKMLITRASIMNNDMIRIDTSVSSALFTVSSVLLLPKIPLKKFFTF